MRILIFGLNYAPELTGIGKYTGEMANWLAEQGHTVRVVTAPPYYPAWSIAKEYRGLSYRTEGGGEGKPLVTRCPLYVPSKPTATRRLLHLLSFAVSGLPVMINESLDAPDVVLTVEPAFFCAPVALMCGAIAHAPTWLHVQDFEVDAAFDLGLLPAEGPIHKFAVWAEQAIMGAFSRVSSISHRMEERALRKNVKPSCSVLFPNWVDIEMVRPSSNGAVNEFREGLGLQDKVVLLYSGNMGNKQGLEILEPLAQAFADDERVAFVFCGDGAFRPALERLASGLPNVMLLPLQPLEKLNDLLNAADIHLLPQRADAADLVMPSKLTGMLASGRPTVATAAQGTQVAMLVGGGPDHAACGVVCPAGDAEGMIAAVRSLVVDAGRRQEMGIAARQYAEQHLSKEHVLRNFERCLQSAVQDYRGEGALVG